MKEDEKEGLENLRAEYAEACSYHRHYSALRYGIFSVYFAVIGAISSVAFGIVEAKEGTLDLYMSARLGALLVTMVFFYLEIMCDRNVMHFRRTVSGLEPALGYSQMSKKKVVPGLRARYATYTLYIAFLLFWVFALAKSWLARVPG